MQDLEIIKQLLAGNHLNNEELERASKLVYLLDLDIKARCKQWTKTN